MPVLFILIFMQNIVIFIVVRCKTNPDLIHSLQQERAPYGLEVWLAGKPQFEQPALECGAARRMLTFLSFAWHWQDTCLRLSYREFHRHTSTVHIGRHYST